MSHNVRSALRTLSSLIVTLSTGVWTALVVVTYCTLTYSTYNLRPITDESVETKNQEEYEDVNVLGHNTVL